MSRLNPFTPYRFAAFGGPRYARRPDAGVPQPDQLANEFPGAPDPSAPRTIAAMEQAPDAPFNSTNFRRRMFAYQNANAAATGRAMTLLNNAKRARQSGDNMRADLLEQQANALMGTDPNLGFRRGLASDANFRANALTGAQVRGMDAETRGIEADTQGRIAMQPIQQRIGTAQASALEIANEQSQKMFPYNIAAAGLRNSASAIANEQNAAMTPFIPQQAQLQIDQGRLGIAQGQQQLQQQASLFPLQLEAIRSGSNLAASQNEQLRQRNRFLEERLLRQLGASNDEIAAILNQSLGNAQSGNAANSTNTTPQQPDSGNAAPLDQNYRPVFPDSKGVLGNLMVAEPKTTQSQQLTPEIARQLLREAGGSKEKARQLAKQRGYTF